MKPLEKEDIEDHNEGNKVRVDNLKKAYNYAMKEIEETFDCRLYEELHTYNIVKRILQKSFGEALE